MVTENITITPSEGTGGGAWADLEAGAYAAMLTAYETAPASTMYPDSGPRLKLSFALPDELDEDEKPVTLFHYVTQKLVTGAKQSNLWVIAEALGKTPQPGVPFQINDLVGLSCQVVVNVKDTQNGPRPFISNVLPAKKAGKAPAPGAPGRAEAAADVCKVEGCGGVVDRYTPRGTPLCAAHTAEDLG